MENIVDFKIYGSNGMGEKCRELFLEIKGKILEQSKKASRLCSRNHQVLLHLMLLVSLMKNSNSKSRHRKSPKTHE